MIIYIYSMYSDILSRIHLALYLTCMLTFYLAFNLEKASGLARCRATNPSSNITVSRRPKRFKA